MPEKIIYPASHLLKDFLPADLLMGLDEAIDFLAVDPDFIKVEWTNTGLATRYRFYILRELSFALPLLSGISIHIGEPDSFPHFDLSFQSNPIPRFGIEHLKLSLRATPNLLQAFERDGEVWRPKPDVSGYYLTWETGLHVDINGKFDFHSPDLSGVPPFMIGETGFIIDFSESVSSDSAADIRWVNSDAPEELIAKLPPNFTGMYIERAGIHYYKPNSGTRLPRFGLEDAAIGTGGFSGSAIVGDEREEPSISAERLNAEDFDPAELTGDHIAGLEVASMQLILWHFRLSFYQSIPNACLLTGLVFIPFADKWMKFKAAIGGPDADFMLEIGGAADQPLISLEHELFEIKADSIAYKLKDDVHYAIITGSLRPKLEGFDWPEMKVDGLSISSEGDIDIPGGWLKAPNEVTLDFHAFKAGISEIGFGNEGEDADKRQWLGFSGSISLVEGLPITASVEGLKFSWLKEPADGKRDLKVSLEGIAVSPEIPNTLKFEGSVRYKEYTAESPSPNGLVGHLFSGNIHINIMALRTEMAGELIIGKLKTPEGHEFTCFYIVLAVELPSAIPLAATGTGIYGLKGLVGLHVDTTKAEESWYEWYLAAPTRNVTSVRKWQPVYDNYAFGAGLTLGTMYDDGFTINLKVLLVVLIPGPVIMLEGKADLLKQRGGDTEQEGAFYTLVVIDGREGTFQMNIDIRYSLSDIITVGAGMEAFFDFNNSSNWFVHIGKKTPESKRIRADILSLFKATAYFMIDSKSLMLGASAGFDFKETYGPVSISFIAKVSFDAAIFWKPLQLEGRIEMLIELALKIFGIGLELFIQLLLEGKAADPYWLHGVARIGLKLPWPLPDLEVQAEFTWEGGKRTEPAAPLLKGASFIHHKNKGLSWELAAYPLDTEPTAEEYILIPVDATPVLSFARVIHNLTKVDSREPLLPLTKDEVGGEECHYELRNLILKEKAPDAATWTTVRNGINTDEGSFILTTESFQNDPGANEPILSLWNYHAMQGATLYEREDYTDRNPACSRRIVHDLHRVHWMDVGEDRDLSPTFRHMELYFMSDVPAGGNTPFINSGWLYTTGVTIRWPEDTSLVSIQFSGQSTAGRGRAYYRGELVAELRSGSGGSLVYYQDNAPIDTVRLETVSGTPPEAMILQAIVYRTTREVYAELAGERDNHPLAEENAHSGTLKLKPNHLYRLEVFSGVSGSYGGYDEETAFYFRTDDGPGIHNLVPIAEPERPEANSIDYHDKPANQLETYIHRVFPADGAPYYYYGYDFGVHFNEAYTEGLFGEDLSLRLFDQNGGELGAGPGLLAIPYLPMPHTGLITWLRAQESNGCGTATEHRAPHRRFTPPDRLRPNQQYRAQLVTQGRSGEHILFAWQFATSRYRTFTEHIESAVQDGSIRLYSLSPAERIRVRNDRALGTLRGTRETIMRESGSLFRETNFLEQVDKGNALRDGVDQFRKDNFQKFTALDELLLPHFAAVGLDKRLLPEKLEFIQILLYRENNVLLLIESPEPIAWERLTAQLYTDDGDAIELGFLSNEDQTRAFVFTGNSFKHKKGAYELSLEFDGSVNPEAGVLFADGDVVRESLRLGLRLGDL